jgi:hypothetical protein
MKKSQNNNQALIIRLTMADTTHAAPLFVPLKIGKHIA